MNRDTDNIVHLERSDEDNRLRRALAARLDKAFTRAGLSSAQAVKRLNVYEAVLAARSHGALANCLYASF
jgi:hypothetical protein